MSALFTESEVESAALAWLGSLGYTILHGSEIAPGEPFAEREGYGQVVLERRLRQALHLLNPDAPADALDEARRRLTRPDSPSLVANNHAVHLYLVEGKAMVVGMSRRICVEFYNAIVALRPDWHHDDDDAGICKIVMTGSASDPLEWQPHIGTKAAREDLARRFKEARDPFKVVIVRDMWLTGFDAPCLHTMYVDKPSGATG